MSHYPSIQAFADGTRVFDISPLVTEKIAVFPGDTPFKRQIHFDYKKGDHLTLSSLSSTLHLGAHADAPNHYHPQGLGIAARSLEYYLGPCQVLEPQASSRGRRIELQDLQGLNISCERVLFKSNSFLDPDTWSDSFSSLSPELIHYLAKQGVKLVGIDTPSIDPADSKDLESHAAIFEHDMAILEGVVLEQVPCGVYQLIALPLRLAECDASPVRAILVAQPM